MRKSASYTLPAVDEGKAAKARVSFTHDGVNAWFRLLSAYGLSIRRHTVRRKQTEPPKA